MTCPCFYKHTNPHLSPLHTKQTQIMRPTYMPTHAHSCTRTHPPTHARTHPTSLTYTHTYTAGICWGDQQRLEHATHTPHTHPHTHPHPPPSIHSHEHIHRVHTAAVCWGTLQRLAHANTRLHTDHPTHPPTHTYKRKRTHRWRLLGRSTEPPRGTSRPRSAPSRHCPELPRGWNMRTAVVSASPTLQHILNSQFATQFTMGWLWLAGSIKL